MKNSGYGQAARAALLVRVLSAAVLVLVLEAMFSEYENEYAYEYDFDVANHGTRDSTFHRIV